MSKRPEIIAALKEVPRKTYREIADALGVHISTVGEYARVEKLTKQDIGHICPRHVAIIEHVTQNPEAKSYDVAKKFGVTKGAVSHVLKKYNLARVSVSLSNENRVWVSENRGGLSASDFINSVVTDARLEGSE